MRITAQTRREKALLEVAERLGRDMPHLPLVKGEAASEVPHLRVRRNACGELSVSMVDGSDAITFTDRDLVAQRSRGGGVSAEVAWVVDGPGETTTTGLDEITGLVDGRHLVQQAMPYVEKWRRLRVVAAQRRFTYSSADFREVSSLLFAVYDSLPPGASARAKQFFGKGRIQSLRLESRFEDILFMALDPTTHRLVEVEPHLTLDPASAAFKAWTRHRRTLHCEAWGRTWGWDDRQPFEILCVDVLGPAGNPTLDINPDVAETAFARLSEMRASLDDAGPPRDEDASLPTHAG